MSETKTPQDFAAFLESLKVNNDGPEEMHGWAFDQELEWFKPHPRERITEPPLSTAFELIEYLVERCRRAAINAKPSDLAEQVKASMRAGMDAQSKSDNAMEKEGQHYWDEVSDEFRRLSEPE